MLICQPGSVQSCYVLESKTVKESIERHQWAWLDAYSPTGSANWDKEVSSGKYHNFSKTFSLCHEFINLQYVQRQERKWERLVENDNWSSGIIQRLSCCTNTLVSKLAARDKQTNYTNGPRRSENLFPFCLSSSSFLAQVHYFLSHDRFALSCPTELWLASTCSAKKAFVLGLKLFKAT